MMWRTSVVLAAAGAVACADLAHTNPVDPDASVTIVVSADRDTITTQNVPITFTAEVGPGFPDAVVHWSYGSPGPAVGTGPSFDVAWALNTQEKGAIAGNHLTMIASVGPHFASRTVILSQRFGGIHFTRCFPICVVFNDPPEVVTIRYQRVDSGGSPFLGVHPSTPDFLTTAGQIFSRDTTIATVVRQTLYTDPLINAKAGAQRGMTWLVYLGNAQVDSIPFYTDLRPRTVTLVCPPTISVDAQAPLLATIRGTGGVPVLAPIGFRWTVSNLTRARVDTLGVINGISPGSVTIAAFDRLLGLFATCTMDVVP